MDGIENDLEYQDLREGVAIDMLRLDANLIEQPVLVARAHERLAKATLVKDKAEGLLSLAKAEMAGILRDEPVRGKQRSEAQINTEIWESDEVNEALAALNDAKFEVNIWGALCKALEARGRSLDKIANLITSGYLTPDSIIKERRAQINAVRDLKTS